MRWRKPVQALVFLGFFVLGVLSLRGVRWAYVTFVVLGLLYFPASVGFRFDPQPCELTFDLPLAVYSLTNYAHIVLFVLFFLMTRAQLRMSKLVGVRLGGHRGNYHGCVSGSRGGHHRQRTLPFARYDSRRRRYLTRGCRCLALE